MELATLVAAERGIPVDGQPHDEGKASAGVQKVPQGKSMGSAATDAQKETMTSYGQRLAANAKPSLEQA